MSGAGVMQEARRYGSGAGPERPVPQAQERMR
jgi:hypothetical protein